MEHPPLRQLHWSDRDLQTTLPAETARSLCAEQSAGTGIQFRVSLELQGKQFDGDSTQLTLKRFKGSGRAIQRTAWWPCLIVKTFGTTNRERHLLGNRSASAADSSRDVAAQRCRVRRFCRTAAVSNELVLRTIRAALVLVGRD